MTQKPYSESETTQSIFLCTSPFHSLLILTDILQISAEKNRFRGQEDTIFSWLDNHPYPSTTMF
jgi:hypothetical protein